MSRTRKLDPVIDMARKSTESALARLGESNALLQQEQHQLDDLQRYREEYMQRFRHDDPMVMSARKALELRGFLAQLDQAIHAQQGQVERHRQQVQKQQQHWLEAKNKEQALDSLMARYQADEAQKQQRQEQRQNDEHTTAVWLRQRRDR
jgi:flagellar FliJ protein